MTYKPGEDDDATRLGLDLSNFCAHPNINGDEDDFRNSEILDIAENILFSAVEDADAGKWCLIPKWTIAQATALFFGKDPQFFAWDPLQRYIALHARIRSCDLMRQRLRAELFKSKDVVNSRDILDWSRKVGFSFPLEIYASAKIESVEEMHAKDEDEFWNSLDPRTKNSLKKFILAMAIEGFGCNPLERKFKGMSRLDEVSRMIFNQPLDEEASKNIINKLASRVNLDKEGMAQVLRERKNKPTIVRAVRSAGPVQSEPPEKTG